MSRYLCSDSISFYLPIVIAKSQKIGLKYVLTLSKKPRTAFYSWYGVDLTVIIIQWSTYNFELKLKDDSSVNDVCRFSWDHVAECSERTVSFILQLIERVKIAHSFLQSVSDQFHIIIISYVILQMGCQRIFRNRLIKMEIWAVLIFGVIFDQPWKSTTVYLWIRTQSCKTIIFVLIVFIICVLYSY